MAMPSETLIQDMVRRIVESARPDKIILFGSRARGNARIDSDFDLIVIKQTQEPVPRRDAALYLALAGMNVAIDVMTYTPAEIQDWSSVPDAFITTAVREGRVLYERQD
jgi:predicted nucleotidyltransferase